MKNTFKALGISLVMLTVSLSANTVFADSSDNIILDFHTGFSETGKGTEFYWKKQDKDLVSSYKLYISDPLSQTESYKTDIPVKHLEDISNPDQNSYTIDFKDLENGKYYRFKLEAYKDSELVGSDTCGSVILGEDYDDNRYYYHFNFGIDRADLHTANVVWTDVYEDNVKRTVKFYRIDEDGFHDFGSADFSTGKYTFENLESDKRYSVAAEVYEGSKMVFTYQFGFSTEKREIKTGGNIKALKDYDFEYFIDKDSARQISVSTYWKDKGASSLLPFKDIKYKIKLSEPLSSEDYFGGKKPSYKSYEFNHDNLSNLEQYYIPFNGIYAVDQFNIYMEAKSGKYFSEDVNKYPESSVFHISGMEPGRYYKIKIEAYYNGKLIASEKTDFINDAIEERDLFFDQEDDYNLKSVKAGSKDGKKVNITWKNIAKTYEEEYPKGKRTIYFYLSSPYKNKKKIYGSNRCKLSAKYAGKTSYDKLKYTLKDLEPGRHYMLYLEVRCNGKIEGFLEYELSTTVNVPIIDLEQTKTNAVKLSSTVDVNMYDLGLVFYKEHDIKLDNTCIKPEFVEYYRIEKNGKYKKIGTAAAGKTLTDKNVTPGKTYTYKARAYSIIDGKKVYSEYSPETDNSIRVENFKPQLKISYANKNKNIIKITNDKNNGSIRFNSDEKICYGFDGKDFYYLSDDLEINPGATVYLDLPKNRKAVDFYYSLHFDGQYYTITLNPKGSTFKVK